MAADEGRCRLSSIGHRVGDVAPLEAERVGDMEASVGDARRQPIGHSIEVARQGLVSARNGAPHPVRVRHHGFALVDEFVDHRAHAAFVVRIRPFETRDFIADEVFELARPGKSTLDAIAHGRDLAPDRMRKDDDLLGRDRFGLGKPSRDLCHRARGQTHFLGPAHERRDDKEEDDGADQSPDSAENSGLSEARGREAVGEDTRSVQAVAASQNPKKRADRRGHERNRARAGLKPLQQLAHGMAVIVGVQTGRDHRARSCTTGIRERLDFGCGELGRAWCRERAAHRDGRRGSTTRLRRTLGRGRRGRGLLLDEVESFLDGQEGRRGRVLGFVLYGHTRLTPMRHLRGLK